MEVETLLPPQICPVLTFPEKQMTSYIMKKQMSIMCLHSVKTDIFSVEYIVNVIAELCAASAYMALTIDIVSREY